MTKSFDEIFRFNREKRRSVEEMWNKNIPGLEISPEEKERIHKSFQSWALHFQRFLLESGIYGLIARYKEVVFNVKTQSCPHTRDGSMRRGEAYFSCCGISYEYFNDISVRTSIEIILASVNGMLKEKIYERVESIDSELKALIVKNSENSHPDFQDCLRWWEKYLPYGVRP